MATRSMIKTFAPLVLLAGLSGCAINALRVEYAGNVGAAGTAAAVGLREFLDFAQQTRNEANIEIIVADPACNQPSAIFREPLIISSKTPKVGDFCRQLSKTDDPKKVTRFSTADPAEDLEPAFQLINVLVDYTDTLADIAAEQPVDAARRIDTGLETAQALEDAFNALVGRQTATIPALDDPRVVAVKGFLDLVLKLKNEADQVAQLRSILADRPMGAKPMIGALKKTMFIWENSRKNDSLLRLGVSKILIKRVLEGTSIAQSNERREALRMDYAARAKARADDRLYPAVTQLLSELQNADEDFRRVIVKDPTLTKAERRKLAEITRQRIVSALQTFTALLKAF